MQSRSTSVGRRTGGASSTSSPAALASFRSLGGGSAYGAGVSGRYSHNAASLSAKQPLSTSTSAAAADPAPVPRALSPSEDLSFFSREDRVGGLWSTRRRRQPNQESREPSPAAVAGAPSTGADTGAGHRRTSSLGHAPSARPRPAGAHNPLTAMHAEEHVDAGGGGISRDGALNSERGAEGNDKERKKKKDERLGTHPLFPSYDAVGVEGAEAAASGIGSSSLSAHPPASSRESLSATGAPTHCGDAWAEEEQLLGLRLPLSEVLSCLSREQRQAFNRRELIFFAPFFVVFVVFLLVGSAPPMHVYLNADALRKASNFDARWMSNLEEQLLLEVFRVDTEAASTASSGDFVPGTSQHFPWLFSYYNESINVWTRQDGEVIRSDRDQLKVPTKDTGTSSNKDSEEAPVPGAVDAQVERVARKHENTNLVRFSSIRSKRDLMRWLNGPFLESLWDCSNPDYVRPWYQYQRGSQRFIGAVQLTATRAATEDPVRRYAATAHATHASSSSSQQASSTLSLPRRARNTQEGTKEIVIPGWCRRSSLNKLKHLPCAEVVIQQPDGAPGMDASSDAPQISASSAAGRDKAAEDQQTTRATDAATAVEAPPHTSPSTTEICANITNPAFPDSTPLIRRVSGDDATGAAVYSMELPFPAACHATRSALKHIATPIRAENETVSMETLWSRYQFTTSETDTSCAAFFFHPRTTELRLRYVVYGASINHYLLVDMRFNFPAAGSVVVPELTVLATPALTWSYDFTALALSVTLGVMLLVYAHHTFAAYLAVFARKRLRWERRGWGGVAGAAQRRRLGGQGRAGGRARSRSFASFMVALQDLLRLRSLAHLCTLGLTTAALVVYWWAWGETKSEQSNVRALSYAQRLHYPVSLQRLCERTAPLYTRLFAAATFFIFVCAVRFACGLFSGLGLVVECLVEAMGRLLPLVVTWLWFAIAAAVAGICVFGATASGRFGDFHSAFLTVLRMFIDRGKDFWADERVQSGFDSMLPSVYGSLMQREGWTPGHAQSYRWVAMHATAGEQTHGAWLFFLMFIEGFLFFAFVAAVITEAFHRTLDNGPNGNKEGVGLEHHQRQMELALRNARRCLCCWPFVKECAARLLWARPRVAVLAAVREQLELAQALHTDLTYHGLLWLLPRALQAEVGPHRLRLWWLEWAEELQAQQRARRVWERRQWLRYWDHQPTGLRGWLQSVVPEEATLENVSTQLNGLLEELPGKVARHSEGVARR